GGAQIHSGPNTFDFHVEPGDVHNIDITVAAITTPEGTLRVSVTGLANGANSGGSASLKPSGGSAQVVPVPGVGLVDTVVAVASYLVTYTSPAGYTLNNGVTNPQTVNVT